MLLTPLFRFHAFAIFLSPIFAAAILLFSLCYLLADICLAINKRKSWMLTPRRLPSPGQRSTQQPPPSPTREPAAATASITRRRCPPPSKHEASVAL